MQAADEVAFLFDVDNTLLDNDRIAKDLKDHLAYEFGAASRDRYWAIFEERRQELGYADYLGALQRYRLELNNDPRLLLMSSFLVDYPFADRVYPGALDAIAHVRAWGRTIIVSDGDVVFQPRKVQRSGLWDAVDGRVLIYIHKEQVLDDVERRYPARHYVMVDDLLRKLDAYWRAANYLSVGQIYLYDNPLLKAPLKLEHVKPRLLGHWGTTPGLNFIYAHLNRIIKQYDLDIIYVTGPGHGGPAMVANTYLEGTYSELYPNVSRDEKGMKRLFTQFSFPGGIPSHAAPETPGSINEGGELGYSLLHAYGAVLDNPDLVACCVVGDGEAETGPLATSWHSNKFLNPARDGAVLPVLHLNGYKIANPTVLARIPEVELRALLDGYGYAPYFVEGDEPERMHQLMAATLDTAIEEIRAIQNDGRSKESVTLPVWPMIVLRTPKCWTGPKVVDGKPVDGTWRAHQVPVTDMDTKRGHLKILEEWLKSYRPEELYDEKGKFVEERLELAPT